LIIFLKNLSSRLLAFLLGLLASIGALHAAEVVDLRCEYRVNPLGIDVLKPRLSWEMKSDRRGEVQTAYQILVASTPVAIPE
jgi:alpha-L-rhamnosidase